MEVGEKLRELNMTGEEIDKLTKAFKDDTFKEMLREYAQEISDPENRRKYEEEIKLLERERGNSLEFIHPKPFRALKTSVSGKQKCFINICGSDKVGKPECKCGVSEDGHRGHNWALPHSLHPGRRDTDPNGNKIMIYDVVFHPDTLHIASKSEKFMDMVVKTATQGIQNAFNVSLDENNVREINTKYKGTPQPCVIRRPIPGYKAKQPSELADRLSFPYPDEKRPATSSQSKPATKTSRHSQTKSFQIQLQKTKEPTKPNYTVKYRSVIDLQDYRCSRDSTKGPRPNEIVVTVDLPLVKSVTDASLEVKERSLLLETKKPAYRLELSLAYSVDEDKGEAKFNKHTGQLIVTLPVLPSDKAYDFALAPASDARRVNESGESEEEEWKEKQGNNGEEENDKEEGKVKEEDLRQTTTTRKGDDDDDDKERGQETRTNKKGQESVEEERGVETQESDKTYESGQEQEDGEVRKYNLREPQDENENKTFSQNKVWGECDGAAVNQEQDVFVHLDTCLASTPKMKHSDIQRQTDNTGEAVHSALKVEEEAAFQSHTSSEESQTTAAVPFTIPASSSNHIVNRGPVTDEEVIVSSGKQEEIEDTDEDKLPAAVLREIDEHGNEKIISNHSTSAGITFQNTLIYQLD